MYGSECGRRRRQARRLWGKGACAPEGGAEVAEWTAAIDALATGAGRAAAADAAAAAVAVGDGCIVGARGSGSTRWQLLQLPAVVKPGHVVMAEVGMGVGRSRRWW
jgi:hypothetical protein